MCCTQESQPDPIEEFKRVFSMFASAEEVTKTGPREEEEAPKDDEPKEAPEAKVSCSNRAHECRLCS